MPAKLNAAPKESSSIANIGFVANLRLVKATNRSTIIPFHAR